MGMGLLGELKGESRLQFFAQARKADIICINWDRNIQKY